MTWPIKSLDSVAVLDRRSIYPSKIDGDTPYLGLEHLDAAGSINCIETVDSAGLKSTKFQFSNKHVLFGKLRPYLQKIVKPQFSGICSTDIIPILPGRELSRDYLFYFLRTPTMVELATRRSSGANLPRLSPKQLASFQIPLPPLAEQKRIARILDAADALRAKRRESLAQLDTLLQSTFLDMFGDPVTNPMGWEVVSMLEIAELENGDRSSNYPSGPDVVEQGVLFLSTKNLDDYHLVFDTCQFITQEKFDSLSRGKLKRNDIVITLRGTLGSCAVFDCQFNTGFINAQLLIIRPHGAETRYLHSLLSSQQMHEYFSRSATGVAVKQLTGKQIGALKIPVPPLPLQRRFASIVESVEKQKARQREHLAELDTLFASLQQRAFNGELQSPETENLVSQNVTPSQGALRG